MNNEIEPTDTATTTEKTLDELIPLARRGNMEAAEAVSRLFKDKPQEFIDRFAPSLDRMAIATILGTFCDLVPSMKNNCLYLIAMQERIDNLRKELAGPKPSALERILVEHIVVAYVESHVASIVLAGAREVTYKQLEAQDKIATRANNRFLKACSTLAHVRRIKLHVLLQATEKPLIPGVPLEPGNRIQFHKTNGFHAN